MVPRCLMVTLQTAAGQQLGSLKGSGTFLHSSSLTDHAFLFEGLAQSLDFLFFSDSDNLILSTNSRADTAFILIVHVPEKNWQVDDSEAAPQTPGDRNTAMMGVIPPPTSRGRCWDDDKGSRETCRRARPPPSPAWTVAGASLLPGSPAPHLLTARGTP